MSTGFSRMLVRNISSACTMQVVIVFLLAVTIATSNAFISPAPLAKYHLRLPQQPKTTRNSGRGLVQSLQGAATTLGPVSGLRLLVADLAGLRTEDVARESWAWSHSSRTNSSVILQLTAEIEEQGGSQMAPNHLLSHRRRLLNALIRHDYSTYVNAATTLGGLIEREDLPNVQDIPYPTRTLGKPQRVDRALLGGVPDAQAGADELVPDCTLPNVTYTENPLDRALLHIFRGLVAKNTGYNSPKEGILGLLEQGREYMLRPGQTAEAQNAMVYNTLATLLTPVMPPIYKTFMSGIWGGKKLGPWPWAPALTSWIVPTFFGFLVGPSRPNRRSDGALGGLVVEKCKFLQESGCKGLCLNICKLPTQQFFDQELGLPLTVIPNFEYSPASYCGCRVLQCLMRVTFQMTQECQWSWGEVPLPVKEDPAFPRGCLTGCPTREALREENKAGSCG